MTFNLFSQNGLNEVSESKYDIWDLTYTLMTSKVHIGIGGALLFIMSGIKYFTIVCLIYMMIVSQGRDIVWIFVIVFSRILFLILALKVSIQTPQTKSQAALRSVWNSKKERMCEYFETVDSKKLFKTVLKGLLPPELAFLYIRGNPQKALELYAGINFISMSIESILYFPFFILYTLLSEADNTFSINKKYPNATIYLAIIS